MKILLEKGTFMILLKLWETPSSFNELLKWCEKGKKPNGRKSFYLYVATLRKRLRTFEEKNVIIKKILKQRINGKFTNYSLTNDGKSLLEQVNQSIQVEISKEMTDKFQKKDLDVLWEKDIFMILSLFWNDSTNQGRNFNSILHFCNENSEKLYSSATLSRKLRFLVIKNVLTHEFLDEWNENGYSIYTITEKGKILTQIVKKYLATKPKVKKEPISREPSKVNLKSEQDKLQDLKKPRFELSPEEEILSKKRTEQQEAAMKEKGRLMKIKARERSLANMITENLDEALKYLQEEESFFFIDTQVPKIAKKVLKDLGITFINLEQGNVFISLLTEQIIEKIDSGNISEIIFDFIYDIVFSNIKVFNPLDN